MAELMLNRSKPGHDELTAGNLRPRAFGLAGLASLSLSMLLSSLSTSIANVALPTLARTVSAAFREIQHIIPTYLLSHYHADC